MATVKQLKSMCKSRGLHNYSRLKKDQLLRLLNLKAPAPPPRTTSLPRKPIPAPRTKKLPNELWLEISKNLDNKSRSNFSKTSTKNYGITKLDRDRKAREEVAAFKKKVKGHLFRGSNELRKLYIDEAEKRPGQEAIFRRVIRDIWKENPDTTLETLKRLVKLHIRHKGDLKSYNNKNVCGTYKYRETHEGFFFNNLDKTFAQVVSLGNMLTKTALKKSAKQVMVGWVTYADKNVCSKDTRVSLTAVEQRREEARERLRLEMANY